MAVERTPINYAQSEGLNPPPPLAEAGPELEIELESEDGSMEPMEPAAPEAEHSANLVDLLEPTELTKLGQELLEGYKSDCQSRSDMDEILRRGIEYLGFNPDSTDKPFRFACEATHPLLAEAVISAQSEAYNIMCPPSGPVKTIIYGKKSHELEAQAKRVRDFMNWQLTDQMPEYYDEHDRLLLRVFLEGTGFKRLYYDASLQRPCASFIKLEDFFIDYHSKSLETAPRYGHRMKLSDTDFLREVSAGFFAPIDIAKTSTPLSTEASDEGDRAHGIQPTGEVFEILEMYVDLNLSIDTYDHPMPYMVHLDASSGQILSIRRNWDEEDPTHKKRTYIETYRMLPGLGFYGFGYIHMIGGLASTATKTMRRLVDAGTFANMPGGFKLKGVRTVKDDPIDPGEWREIEGPVQDVNKLLMPNPYKEPSPALLQLLQFVITSGQQFANAARNVVADSSNYGPVQTTLALLEKGGTLMAAVYKRLLRSQTREFKILARINRDTIGEKYPFRTVGDDQVIASSDFDDRVDVAPVADPDNPTEAHRTARAHLALQIAQQFPQEHNLREALLRLYSAAGIDEPEKLLAQPPKPGEPLDPISENMYILNGEPVAAAEHQEHAAHIKVHSMLLNNPQYNKIPQIALAAQAHIQEHLAHKMRRDFMQAMGTELPPLGEKLPPEVENQISVAAASIEPAITQANISEETKEQNEQAMMDPAVKLQLEELSLRRMETEERLKDADLDRALKLEELKLKERLELAKLSIQKETKRATN